MFYWATVMFSQTLGTALGDGWPTTRPASVWAMRAAPWSSRSGWRLVAAAYYSVRISHVFLFWAAFILTRPPGATVGDFLDKPRANGGLELSRYWASAVLAVFIVACIALLPKRAERRGMPTPGEVLPPA